MKDFIAITVAIGLALTSAGAHETMIDKTEDGKRTVIKIVGPGHGDHAKHMMHLEGCKDGDKAADIDQDVTKDGKRERQRVLICSKSGHSSADAAKHLSEARDRIAKDDNLSAEIKAKVLASLDAAIARHSKP